ncbi:MAG TPA: response regulator [Gammaproteobacteria bacterium]|nr:response regulator [Gammaproteobacteria bacterium]
MPEDDQNPTPYHLLIVDDDEQHRRLEKEFLCQFEHEVVEASNGLQALEILRSQDFDAVLLDKQMPELDGDQLCEKIRNELNLHLLPLIMVTGNSDRTELVKSLKAGANDFIRKPYNQTELIARINSAVKLKRATDQLDDMESMLFTLARMIEAKDKHTGNHCARLSHIAVVFGKKLGLCNRDLLALKQGGILHDIGKLGVPDNILAKPGKLNPDEWRIMQKHSLIGYEMCKHLKSMRHTLPIIAAHHERLDGSGYPYGLKGDEIPYIAQVFQLVDIFDALTFERPYKPAFSIEKTKNILAQEVKNKWRDPKLVNSFFELIDKQPEDLQLPENYEQDMDELIFSQIVSALKE